MEMGTESKEKKEFLLPGDKGLCQQTRIKSFNHDHSISERSALLFSAGRRKLFKGSLMRLFIGPRSHLQPVLSGSESSVRTYPAKAKSEFGVRSALKNYPVRSTLYYR